MKLFTKHIFNILETAPSFEEMGLAISAVIAESQGGEGGGMEDDGEEGGTALSPEHQMLMTWAWINIKVWKYGLLSIICLYTLHIELHLLL